MTDKPLVAVIMGSTSDWDTMCHAAEMLERFSVPFEKEVVSAHRTPDLLFDYARQAAGRGLHCIIAGAGGSAHLPGMVASLTHLPVIGVPVQSKSLAGVDSLYSIVQMPPGVPVATVAINGALNAGLLASQILSLNNSSLSKKLISYKKNLDKTVKTKAGKLERVGHKKYLNQ